VRSFKVYDYMKLTVMNLCGTVATYTIVKRKKKNTLSNEMLHLQRLGEDDQKNARKSNSVHAWYTCKFVI
jgi:hypothetical protein